MKKCDEQFQRFTLTDMVGEVEGMDILVINKIVTNNDEYMDCCIAYYSL